MVMWHPPTPAEQELWNAVVAAVRTANQTDHAGFEAAVGRLSRLPQPWAHQVLKDTAGLLADELDPDGRDPGPLLAAQLDHRPVWLSKLDRKFLPGGHHASPGDLPGEAENIRCRLLLIAHLADAAQVGVGAFLDVALASNSSRTGRPPAGSVPHCRTGR
ncbi:hypothetical protein GCM10023176_16580 [Micromonospora coerulea]|uniref:Uncharacterized protein n=1 Tax=Micromonospora coerulea TaxID=47856 RepID=A0ABP8SDX5_9ACTN